MCVCEYVCVWKKVVSKELTIFGLFKWRSALFSSRHQENPPLGNTMLLPSTRKFSFWRPLIFICFRACVLNENFHPTFRTLYLFSFIKHHIKIFFIWWPWSTRPLLQLRTHKSIANPILAYIQLYRTLRQQNCENTKFIYRTALFERLALSLFIAKETGREREAQSSGSWKWRRSLLWGREYLSISKK